jgi:hypothetical protein
MSLLPGILLCVLNLAFKFQVTTNRAVGANTITSERIPSVVHFTYTDTREVVQINSIATRISVSLGVHNTFPSPLSLPCVHDDAASVKGREGGNQKHETAWSYSIQQRGVASEMVREEVQSLNTLTTGLHPL